jgi:hypothetical protein
MVLSPMSSSSFGLEMKSQRSLERFDSAYFAVVRTDEARVNMCKQSTTINEAASLNLLD